MPADRPLAGSAALTLLATAARHRPLLVLVDDAQWLDPSSQGVLAFAGRRLAAHRVTLVIAARGPVPPLLAGPRFPRLRLAALSAPDAGRLLDAQPSVPRGHARARVLAEAEGNPMAIIELSRALADDPAAARHGAIGPLPVSSRAAAPIVSRLAALPAQARSALLLAAVAEGPDTDAARRAGARPGAAAVARAVAAAEQAGLAETDGTALRFTHPLVRSALYHGVPFSERAAAHLRLADALHDQPDRRAFHQAAAALQPDEQVAAQLEETAVHASRRGGALARALALERSAEVSPAPDNRARRLASAAVAAISTGQADWVRDLAERAIALTTDPEVLLTARDAAGWALAWSRPGARRA